MIDGNYSAARPLIWARADTVIWLDLPRHTVMRQVTWRTPRRLASRQELWNGNRESWRTSLSVKPERSTISWAWHSHAKNHAKYAAAAHPDNAHLTLICLTNRRDITRFLSSS